jgi:peptide/nickel transport system ATP-binding protein
MKSRDILVLEDLNLYALNTFGEKDLALLRNINFKLGPREILGLVGETGAGKSLLINAIGKNLDYNLRLTGGQLLFRYKGELVNLLDANEERMGEIWGRNISFILSNTRGRFHPLLTVGEQFSNIIRANFQVSYKEAYERAIEMFRLVQMPDPQQNFSNYPHELSGGMVQRVAIAIALSMSPTLLLADEPTMGLDVTVQRQVLDLMSSLFHDRNSSIVLATRDLGIVANYCKKVAVMFRGEIVELAPVQEFFKRPRHPYSKYLLQIAFASNQKIEEEDMKFNIATKDTYRRHNRGCFFADSCLIPQEKCWTETPQRIGTGEYHYVKCHRGVE